MDKTKIDTNKTVLYCTVDLTNYYKNTSKACFVCFYLKTVTVTVHFVSF